MNTFSHNNGLFMPSGCLSPEAVEGYAGKILSEEEMELVDKHLSSCAFCRDAVEGASQIPHFSAHSSIINERLRSRFNYMPGRRRKSPSISNFLLPAAASVILLAGIIAWFHYFYPERQELAVMTDTIPTQIDDLEMQQKSEAGTSETEKGEAARIGGVMNRDNDKADNPPDETKTEPAMQQEAPPEVAVVENDLMEDAAPEEVYEEETIAADENTEAAEMKEKAGGGQTGLDMTVARKSATATRQMEGNNKAFAITEKKPEYPGGPDSLQSFLIHNLQYPIDVDQKKDTTVTARFIVSEKGEIRDINIVRSAGKAFDDEVIRVIRLMPEWIPAKQGGKPIAVTYSLPVRFESD